MAAFYSRNIKIIAPAPRIVQHGHHHNLSTTKKEEKVLDRWFSISNISIILSPSSYDQKRFANTKTKKRFYKKQAKSGLKGKWHYGRGSEKRHQKNVARDLQEQISLADDPLL